MTRPCAAQVSLADTSYYHCVARCVRRAYFCGIDHLTGENYEHRCEWEAEQRSVRVHRNAVVADAPEVNLVDQVQGGGGQE